MSTTEAAVPDLLRRFAPTPQSSRTLISGVRVELQSDDVEIVARMQPKAGDSIGSASQTLLLAKVVRDRDAPPDASGVTIISAPPLITLLAGIGTVLVLDCQRREIVGFLGSSISAERFVDELLPTLVDRLKMVDASMSGERIADAQ